MQRNRPPPPFADRLLAWWDEHGRKDLPWQHPRAAYRVWISEIMLQQTQVATVIPYFERWMASFPDVRSLAAAPLDEVLAHWSGLGYYARARNLHRTAQLCVEGYGGELPLAGEALSALPGIGLSTANAIVSQATDRPAAVLDGNVRRVLARHAAVNGWSGRSAVQKRLWTEAESRLPATRGADYTQAATDLGVSAKPGLTVSAPGFFAPQGRDIARLEPTVPDLDKVFADYDPRVEGQRVENMEMESSFLIHYLGGLGYWVGAICPAIANRRRDTFDVHYQESIENAIKVGLAALAKLRNG